MNLKTLIASGLRKHPRLFELLRNTVQEVSPETVAVLDYPIILRQRWDQENPHQELHDLINRNRNIYRSNLQGFLSLSKFFTTIPVRSESDSVSSEPCWINGYLPALDGIALYGFIVNHKPGILMEVGSGYSTRFARKAIADHNLDTRIVSIDPSPRAEVNDICDEVIRKPAEEVDIRLFDQLDENDILFVDNSHRVFMNSDATAIFLDVIPRLKPGVLVEIHDVTLPYDYPLEWSNRYFSEQYLLAAYILARGNRFDIILPNTFIKHDSDLRSVLAPLWDEKELKDVEKYGCSFWLMMK